MILNVLTDKKISVLRTIFFHCLPIFFSYFFYFFFLIVVLMSMQTKRANYRFSALPEGLYWYCFGAFMSRAVAWCNNTK